VDKLNSIGFAWEAMNNREGAIHKAYGLVIQANKSRIVPYQHKYVRPSR
jgi:hypothetical protein